MQGVLRVEVSNERPKLERRRAVTQVVQLRSDPDIVESVKGLEPCCQMASDANQVIARPVTGVEAAVPAQPLSRPSGISSDRVSERQIRRRL